jgi:membrane associated rhomboid family serine protease
VGASGGLFGLLGLLLVCSKREGQQSVSQGVMKTAAYNFLFGLYDPRISNAAHFGGFVTGILVGAVCGRRGGRGREGWRDGKQVLGGVLTSITVWSIFF